MIADLPGKCTDIHKNCPYEGRNYSIGESFKGLGDNWCNNCICLENGAVACTLMMCPPCPDEHTVNCLVNPCDVTTCPTHPNATCRPNYCYGCNHAFFDEEGKEVDCS